MSISLSPTQIFQNQVNSVTQALSSFGNTGNAQSLAGQYARMYDFIFANSKGTPAEAVANMGTSGAATLNGLSAAYTCAIALGATGLTAVPAFTANEDGTATLVTGS